MIYVGVDLGTKGGIVAVDEKERIVFAAEMPVIETVTQARKKLRLKGVKTAYGTFYTKFPLIVYRTDGSQSEATFKKIDGIAHAIIGKGKKAIKFSLDAAHDGVVSVGQITKKTAVRDVTKHDPDFLHINEVVAQIVDVADGQVIRVFMEGAFMDGSLMMTNMRTIAVLNQYHGSIKSAFIAVSCEPQVVRPSEWQKMFWQKTPEDTKAASISACRELFDGQTDFLTRANDAGKAYMHDGLCDAALIAVYNKRVSCA